MVSKVAGPPANEISSSQSQNADDYKAVENKTPIVQHHTDEHSSTFVINK